MLKASRHCPEGADQHLRLQMLAFLQHPYMLLAAKAMAFWTSLLFSSERAAGRAEPLTAKSTPIPLDCVAALMDLAGGYPWRRGSLAASPTSSCDCTQLACQHRACTGPACHFLQQRTAFVSYLLHKDGGLRPVSSHAYGAMVMHASLS